MATTAMDYEDANGDRYEGMRLLLPIMPSATLENPPSTPGPSDAFPPYTWPSCEQR